MKKSTRLNILFAIIILLAAGVLWLCFGHPAAGSGLVAVLTYGDDSTQLRIPLDTDHRYDIDTGYYPSGCGKRRHPLCGKPLPGPHL